MRALLRECWRRGSYRVFATLAGFLGTFAKKHRDRKTERQAQAQTMQRASGKTK